MNYEYAIRDYDRTYEGNIPKKYEFKAKTDLQAFAIAFYNIHSPKATDKDIIKILIDEGILNRSCLEMSSKEIIKILCDIENENIDASDAFIFYIYNLDKDRYVYENNVSDVEDWIYDMVMGGEWDPDFAQRFIDDGWDYDFLFEMVEGE